MSKGKSWGRISTQKYCYGLKEQWAEPGSQELRGGGEVAPNLPQFCPSLLYAMWQWPTMTDSEWVISWVCLCRLPALHTWKLIFFIYIAWTVLHSSLGQSTANPHSPRAGIIQEQTENKILATIICVPSTLTVQANPPRLKKLVPGKESKDLRS